jgi:hypothetical protein
MGTAAGINAKISRLVIAIESVLKEIYITRNIDPKPTSATRDDRSGNRKCQTQKIKASFERC